MILSAAGGFFQFTGLTFSIMNVPDVKGQTK